MRPIWQIDANDVIGLQGKDVDFAQFLNDLLTLQAALGGVAFGALQLNLKTHVPDGGVDASVAQPIPLDPSGYFSVATCWQYKASPTGNIKPSKKKKGGQEAALREEIGKPEAATLVKAGYGYRFCIAADMPSPTKTKWEAWLLDQAQKIVANPSPPRVVTATDLTNWANRLPGVILPFRPYLGSFRSLRTWGKEITKQTPEFVPVAAWQQSMQVVHNHADVSLPCIRVLQTVQGETGVGKTRCVYESLVSQDANNAVVVYTDNEEEAEKLADILANDDRFTAILVADECSVESRVRLERRLQACANRLRVIAIDNRQQDEPTGGGEIRLERMEEQEVEKILQRRHPQLSHERLRAFVGLSGGFVRLALDLCDQSSLIPPEGHIGSLLDFFRDHYLRHRLPHEEERKIIEAVALLPKVGFKGDVRQQLEWLCQAVDLKPDRVVETAARLKQAPGFIALGERYLYVTPRLIAQAAFQSAWARWIRPDPDRFFLDRLRGELLDGFAEQLRVCGSLEMRQVFSRFFQNWIDRLAGSDLADDVTVQRLVRLVEVEPQTLLPQLRRLIESVGIEELRQFHSRSYQSAARRELVWLADRFLRLPEHFADAERIVLRLALAETEVYANNASGVWKDLFRPLLSGTPIPFAERIHLLEERFQTTDDSQLTLCLGALDGALPMNGPIVGRPLGPPVIAGRIPPPDWHPRNPEEMRECWTSTHKLLQRLIRLDNAALRDGIVRVTIKRLSALLSQGFLEEVREILSTEPLSDLRLAELLQALDQFLQVFCAPDSKHVPADLETAVRAWRQSLVPQSLHGQLIALIGQVPWQLRNQGDDHGEGALASLAQGLLADPSALECELSWLCSRDARSATQLGVVLGRLDAKGTHLERIVDVAAASQYPGIARGYIAGLAQHHSDQVDRVNELLDRLQGTNPRAVFELIYDGFEPLRPLERLLAMVDVGRLAVESLQVVNYGIGNRSLTPAELRQVLDRLMTGLSQGNEAAGRAALTVLYSTLFVRAQSMHPDIASDPWLRANLGSILTATLPFVGAEAHAWNELLEYLGGVDLKESLRLAVLALFHDDLQLHMRVQSYLVSTASREPTFIMERLGETLLDAATGWRLAVYSLRNLLHALPVEAVKQWLEEYHRPGAIALARHLPLPYIDETGDAIVPTLTAYVLEQFAEDDRVFQEFCEGVHCGQTYIGDIAAQHEQEREIARRFLDHPLQRVREWAQYEIDSAEQNATRWRIHDEEMATP